MLGNRTIAVAMLAALLAGCVESGSGTDFDADGIIDTLEDLDGDFVTDIGETDLTDPDTDDDGLCDGPAPEALAACVGCEDCNGDGAWDPCGGETDPLNGDTDEDGIPDAQDPAPLDGIVLDCAGSADESA